MFDFDELFKGYSTEDEFIARDLLLMELLEEKGIITKQEIKNKYDKLANKIKEVHEYRIEEVKKEYDKLKEGK